MSPPLDSQLLHFDIWESLDEESMRLTQTSEFWTQVQYEAERLDLVPPANLSDHLQDSDEDWRIEETHEDPHKDNIVHHDCMWAGSCVDSVHPSNNFVPSDHIPATPGQSLLRRDISPSRPDTPPSLDGDEPPQFRHAVDVAGTALRLLRDSAAVAADHSYTLARQHRDYLGVQTPSDSGESEEEIDVVSLGTTQQPFAPTTTTTPNNMLRPETLVRAASMPDRRQAQRPLESATSRTPRSPPRPIARKRLVPPASVMPGGARRRARGPGRRGRRSNTDTDSEAESPEIERRSIHNDMERQRRIGLKNLFDELKMQIPATRDKERAPKVVILREAAALCKKLSQEDIEREKLRKKQNQLMARLKKLRKSLSARYHPY
ncbi:myc proto-oncogene protein [Bombyx mandarina]|uniref:C-myc n=2 Tax=Bombyx TaxID=7090 RepID=F8WT28_BOMMO|nr:c-myc [Bombyx mori]XP_021204322.1 c-myc isoform X1 [Bombyx mori]XP_028030502.1 myc proto-oncogene protein [Bombyx mandarina]BAK53865.1 c-myc [Bombyx mori]